jgi:hypothetical protein
MKTKQSAINELNFLNVIGEKQSLQFFTDIIEHSDFPYKVDVVNQSRDTTTRYQIAMRDTQTPELKDSVKQGVQK